MNVTRPVLPLLLALALVTPALARVAAIETTAPLADHSEEGIKAAIKQAVVTAVRGAVAMGFQWVQVRQAVVFTDLVSVQILASDQQPDGEEEWAAPDDEGPETTRPAGIEI
jgi:hypothetical protein